MENKPKKCNGIGKANGFIGCLKEVVKRTFGLCDSCLYYFYTTDERGKIEFAKRKLKNHTVKEKAFKSDLRQKLKTLSEYEAEAKKSFQKFIRLRDDELNCISCGTSKAKIWHGSHFYSANLYSGLIFNENNVHKSCDYCNVFLHGNLLEYRKGLIERYGLKYVEQLESLASENRVYKYTKDELINIKKKYDAKIKES